jgi:hypothetical protein
MRRKPVSRDEVRFNGWRITTMPVDSVSEPKQRWGQRSRSPPLWAPLLRALNRKRRGPESIQAPRPYHDSAFSCRVCDRQFYQVYGGSGSFHGGSGRYCSDLCAAAARTRGRATWAAKMVAARSAARAAARADRRCRHCGEPIAAQRSTRFYCSDHCRITAHR